MIELHSLNDMERPIIVQNRQEQDEAIPLLNEAKIKLLSAIRKVKSEKGDFNDKLNTVAEEKMEIRNELDEKVSWTNGFVN